MTATVVKLQPVSIGDGYRFDHGDMLESAKERETRTLLIIGEDNQGNVWLDGSANIGELLLLVERAKHSLIFDPNAA